MEDLTKGENDVRSRLPDILLRLGGGRSLLLGTCIQRVRQGLGCHTQGVGSGEVAGRRGRGGKVEIRIEAQIRAAGEEEEARARATATRWRGAETVRAERYEMAWI